MTTKSAPKPRTKTATPKTTAAKKIAAGKAVPTRAETPAKTFSLISNETLIALDHAMAACRWLTKKNGADWRIEPGAEAVLAGVLLTLEKRDRSLAGPWKPLAAQVRGEGVEQRLKPAGARAARPATALAQARRLKLAGKQAALAVFLAGNLDAAWKKVLSSAAREKLAILLVWQTEETARPAFENSLNSVPRIPVDAADAVAVYRVATECLAHARRGHGPSLIECVRFAQEAGPLDRMQAYLESKGLWRAEARAEALAALKKALRKARTR